MKKTIIKEKKIPKGFTALELIIVLIVGFSIIALSASKMGDLFSASSSAEANSSILSLYTATRALRTASGYEEDLIQVLIDTDTLPKNLGKDSSSRPLNEWGASITITTHSSGAGFDLIYPGVPKTNCIKLLQALAPSGTFDTLKANGTEVTRYSKISEMNEACSVETAAGNELTLTVGTGS